MAGHPRPFKPGSRGVPDNSIGLRRPVDVIFDTPQETLEGGMRLAPVETQWDGYGEAIDVRGEVLVVGASEWNQCGMGSVYVYRLSDGAWQKEAQLVASDREAFAQQARQFEGMRFGTSVALGEGIIAVGAPGSIPAEEDRHSSAVYLYKYDGQTWGETAKLQPSNAPTSPPSSLTPAVCTRFRPQAFGAFLALDGDTLAVGGDASGAVYLYQQGENGWQEQAQISIPTVSGQGLHLASMSLMGDTLALSAFYPTPQEQPSELSPVMSGHVVVYLFARVGETWQESFRFTPDDGETDLLFFRELNFGASVALGGDAGGANLLAVGLPGFPDWSNPEDALSLFGTNPEQPLTLPKPDHQTGAVYLFERAGEHWNEQATLKPTGWDTPPGLGAFPSLPTHLEEGQETSDETGAGLLTSADGSEFVFPGDLWSENPAITFFGATVALDGTRLAVTAGFANTTYVFERAEEGWQYRFSVKPVNENMEVWEDYAQGVRISGHTLLLGTPGEFGNSAYVFALCTPLTPDCD